MAGFKRNSGKVYDGPVFKEHYTEKEESDLNSYAESIMVSGIYGRELLDAIESGKCRDEIDFVEGSFEAFKTAVKAGKYDVR